MIITNVELNDLEDIFNLQGTIFKEEPLLTYLPYFNDVITLEDLQNSYNKYDFLKAVEE